MLGLAPLKLKTSAVDLGFYVQRKPPSMAFGICPFFQGSLRVSLFKKHTNIQIVKLLFFFAEFRGHPV